jgi:hypothetical protein
MLRKLAVRLTNYLLARADLSVEQRNSLIVHIMDATKALPLNDMIAYSDEGELLINGRTVSVEKGMQLRESAKAALENQALNIITTQVAWLAVTLGVHKLQGVNDQYFMRTALWWGQRQQECLKLLAGTGTSPNED